MGPLSYSDARSLPTEPRSMRDKGKRVAVPQSKEPRGKGKGKAKAQPTLEECLLAPSSSLALTARLLLEQQLSNPSLLLTTRLNVPRPPSLAERLQSDRPLLLVSSLAPPKPVAGASMQQCRGFAHALYREKAKASSLADWLATHLNLDTLPRCFVDLLQRNPPAHDGRT
jgi:hypothetical protein